MKKINALHTITFFAIILIQNNLIGQSQLKAVHEWGTFTTVQNSAGLRLPGLKGEKLPAFVYDMNPGYKKNIEFKNVEVQMETPVLYFYADKQLDATVDVKFKNGIINQWYPNRFSGQMIAPSSIVDLSIPSEGNNLWKITILDSNASVYLKPPVGGGSLYEEYSAPRYVNANCIKGQGASASEEYEKFIFYRGLGNFETPVKVEFNDKGNLVIQNQFNDQLSYVLIFDNSPDRQPTVWWSGSLKRGEKKVVANPFKDSEYNELNQHIGNFLTELEKSGLYSDEAEALLNTWFDSYFIDLRDVEGLRVFWIAPHSYVDQILPLSITPTPLETNRVFVGRSEILKKGFEEELSRLTIEEIDSIYKYHHYVDVFKEAKKKGLPTQWTDYNDNVITSVKDNSKIPLTLKLMPNPIQESFIMQYRSEALADIHVSILDLSGNVIRQWKEIPTEMLYKKSYSMKDLLPGAYILQTRQNEKVNTVRFIKQ